MYAIIRTGGKQSKVREGDVIDVERLRDTDDTMTFTPLLIVQDDGSVVSGRKNLEAASVKAKVVGGGSGEKVDIFKYKNKTGYRRRAGHRQKFTTIEITKINVPSGKQSAAADEAEEA